MVAVEIAVVVVLVLINGVLALSELAVISARRGRYTAALAALRRSRAAPGARH